MLAMLVLADAKAAVRASTVRHDGNELAVTLPARESAISGHSGRPARVAALSPRAEAS